MMKVKKYKGIVLKVTDKHIVLMCEDGVFRNVPLKKSVPKIGEKFECKQKEWIGFSNTRYLSIASLLFIVLVSSFFFININKKDAYILAIDINPSIELYADKDLKVSKVVALNSDGQKVIEGLSIENKSTNELITEILEQTVKQNYLTRANKGVVAITTVSLGNLKDTEVPDVQQIVGKALNSTGISADIITHSTDEKTLKLARNHHMSVTKYLLYTDLESKGIKVKMEDIKEQSIQQIQQLEKASIEDKDSVKDSSIDNPENNQSTTKLEERPPTIVVKDKENRKNDSRPNEGNSSAKKSTSQIGDKEGQKRARSEAKDTSSPQNTDKEEESNNAAKGKNREVRNQEETSKDSDDDKNHEKDEEKDEEKDDSEERNEEDHSNKESEEAPKGKKENSGKP
ncbi:anti-sigma-I factor RsgI family protein [Litchfieldia alkalitelluris]|uniref:anti-sigma-I factor RsgI family protein n=1 Tax=Litchfieldia alkalitelluris TaxID=304268 RepID=UPI00099787C5|nr:hypothetical protein [Litchfieldia alkalitelluris]